MSMRIPIIDLERFESADSTTAKRELDRACQEVGFLVIANHGVDAYVQDALVNAGSTFFDLPTSEKMVVRRPRHDQNRGYIPYGEETLARMQGYAGLGSVRHRSV